MKSVKWYRMKKYLLLLVVLMTTCCSKPNELAKIQFTPELIIGEDIETEGAWFSTLNDFWVDEQENMFCVDGGDRKIKVFDKNGKPVFCFGQKGQGPGEFSYPNGIAVSKAGNIYIADAGRRSLIKFDNTGKFIHSIQIGSPIAKIRMFDSGNIVLEIARFAVRKEIKESIFELAIYDANLKEVKTGIFEKPVENYAWINVSKEHIVTQQIPFAPKIVWHIIGNQLYVGYTDEFKISVFDESGNYVKNFSKNVDREKVTGDEKNKWIERKLKNFKDRPGFVPEIMKESLEKVNLPSLKPAFTVLGEMDNGLIVFGNPGESEFPATLFDKEDIEVGQAIFEFDNFKYFNGKYYRIITEDEEPAVLVRYPGAAKLKKNNYPQRSQRKSI